MAGFLIGALRAVIELIGWSLLAQGLLALLAGKQRHNNAIYRLFEFLTRPPRLVVARLVRRPPDTASVAATSFCLLFVFWIGLAILRKFL